MISYELAKKLKDAGFPNSNSWEDKGHWFERENHVVPNLSELIAACGKPLTLNSKSIIGWSGEDMSPEDYEKIKDKEWHASKIVKEIHSGIRGQIFVHAFGDTEIETVTNLYLALHDK